MHLQRPEFSFQNPLSSPQPAVTPVPRIWHPLWPSRAPLHTCTHTNMHTHTQGDPFKGFLTTTYTCWHYSKWCDYWCGKSRNFCLLFQFFPWFKFSFIVTIMILIFMCVCVVYICMYTCMHVCVGVYVCVHVCMCTCAYICVCVHVWGCVQVYVLACACLYVHMCMHVYVCVLVCEYAWTQLFLECGNYRSLKIAIEMFSSMASLPHFLRQSFIEPEVTIPGRLIGLWDPRFCLFHSQCDGAKGIGCYARLPTGVLESELTFPFSCGKQALYPLSHSHQYFK